MLQNTNLAAKDQGHVSSIGFNDISIIIYIILVLEKTFPLFPTATARNSTNMPSSKISKRNIESIKRTRQPED